jgi:hypothetical protein
MHPKKVDWFQFFVVASSLFVFVPAAVGDTVRLWPVPPMAERQAARDLASWTAGTRLFQSAAGSDWELVEPLMGSFGAGNLQSNDPNALSILPMGKKDVLFQFNLLERVDRLTFRQQSAGGRVQVYAADAPYAVDSPRWRRLNDTNETGSESLVNLEFPLTSMRFLRMSFDYPAGGEVGPLFLSGDARIEKGGSPVPPPDQWPESDDRVEFDFARLSSEGRIAYVGSGIAKDAYRMVDGDPTTFFEFAAVGQDTFFIVTLPETYPVFQASITTTAAIRAIDVWTFNNSPGELFAKETDGGEAGELAIPSEYFSTHSPTGRVDAPDDEEVTALTIPLPDSTARYMLVRVVGKYSDEPVQVTMFSVLGRVPRKYFGLRDRPSFVPPPTSEPLNPTDPPRVNFASP